MAEEWNPNTPNMNNDFNQVKETQDIEREPVSKIELDRLNAEREAQKLVYEPHLTIGGIREQTTHTEINKEREVRINHIEERLNSYQDKARNDFNMMQQEQDKKEIKQDQGRSY